MQSQMAIEFDKTAFNRIDAALAQIETNVRGTAMNRGLRAIGSQVKQQTVAVLPKPGYERFTRTNSEPYQDKDGPKPLGQAIKTKIVDYAGGLIKVAIIGYEWPAGAHGHIVETGHDMVVGGKKKSGGRVVGHIEPAEYMVTVVEKGRSSFDSIVISEARKLIKV
jgi:hypothetical protein